MVFQYGMAKKIKSSEPVKKRLTSQEYPLIDAHCHLTWNSFEKDLDDVIKRAKQNNIKGIITVSATVNEVERNLEICRKYKNYIFPCMGLIPRKYFEKKSLEILKEKIEMFQNEIVGIGEVGLDFYWVKERTARAEMIKKFQELLPFIKKIGKPLVIHARNAEHKTMKILRKHNFDDYKVLFHCYAGDTNTIKEIVSNTCWCFTVPTSVTYRRDNINAAKHIPLNRMMLETDAPFLAPNRNIKRNEPKNIIYGAKKVAELKKEDLSVVAKKTTKAAIEFFELTF